MCLGQMRHMCILVGHGGGEKGGQSEKRESRILAWIMK